MTHADLVGRAGKWLRNSAAYTEPHSTRLRRCRCGVVLTENHGGSWEVPDAIGWAFGGRVSILLECKVSRADFLADWKKTVRKFPPSGIGRYRYYLTPPRLIGVDELPPLWGLLEAEDRRVRVVRPAERHPESNTYGEMALLWSELRLWQIVQAGGKLLGSKRADSIMATIGRAG